MVGWLDEITSKCILVIDYVSGHSRTGSGRSPPMLFIDFSPFRQYSDQRQSQTLPTLPATICQYVRLKFLALEALRPPPSSSPLPSLSSSTTVRQWSQYQVLPLGGPQRWCLRSKLLSVVQPLSLTGACCLWSEGTMVHLVNCVSAVGTTLMSVNLQLPLLSS